MYSDEVLGQNTNVVLCAAQEPALLLAAGTIMIMMIMMILMMLTLMHFMHGSDLCSLFPIDHHP